MSFLDNKNLEKILPDCIDPYIENNLENACYELSLGNEYFKTTNQNNVKTAITEGGQITIEPGQFALLITKENVKIPPNLLAFISIKASIKFCGLVNISGFHVDPGFDGKLKFSVYNAGSKNIILDEGKPLFPIWFCKLTSKLANKDIYDGKFQGQKEISREDVTRIHGEILSPNVLNEKIKNLENTKIKDLEKAVEDVNTKRTILLTIGGSILLLALGVFVNTLINNHSYNLGETQGQIQTKVDNISNKTINQEESIQLIQKKLNDIEEKIDNSKAKSTP